ncbi:MAG: hypothetical protein M1820_000685 [Bogoriella megaspora]|nr:MAG: hypothetical protein M1820_000685 [Bogoriella megaspora]
MALVSDEKEHPSHESSSPEHSAWTKTVATASRYMKSPIYQVLFGFLVLFAYRPSLLKIDASWLHFSSRSSSHIRPCKCFPGDPCWPTLSEWQTFNETIGGKLIATIPLASVCHDDQWGSFDAEACSELQDRWFSPETHWQTSSSAMAPFFANMSCDPWYPKDAQCVVGSYVQYSVNATSVQDYQKTIAFTTAHNIRLVIRSTGHDYLGKSTGAGAVAIWTHHNKQIDFLDYKSSYYTGKAIKVGAGVHVIEASEAAQAQGLAVVGGNCATVGVAGGFTQGGGHGPLASAYGMSADQVLEWEVVTGKGDHVIATPTNHSDLYFALSGGGGGTYGVVLSQTSKAYKDPMTSAANLTFSSQGVTETQFYDVVQVFLQNISQLVDEGAVVIWVLAAGPAFLMNPTTAPGFTKAQLDAKFEPVFEKLKSYNITYAYYSEQFSTYLDSFREMNTQWPVANMQLGGRLIPRSVVEKDVTQLLDAFRAGPLSYAGGVISGVSINVTKKADVAPNAVLPAWREALFDCVFGLPWDNTNWTANLEVQDVISNKFLPPLEALTPGGGAYLSEGDFRQPDFQQVFYGKNYDKLLSIKQTYDPNDIFYAVTAVGSEAWTEDAEHRLCRTETL